MISNLTNWHFSCREIREGFNRDLGGLTKKENRALSRFKKLLLKYNFGSFKKSKDDPGKFLGIPFITRPDNKVWSEVEGWVEESEYQVIRKVFDIFEERFRKIWRRELPKLKAWKSSLDKELKKKRYQKLEDDLKAFFKTEPLYMGIDVYLLISAHGHSGGGANVGPAKLTLECSGRPLNQLRDMVMGLYHELAHLSFERGPYGESLKKFIRRPPKVFKNHPFAKQEMKYRVLINEGVVSNLLPEGYLTEKYSKPDGHDLSLTEVCERRFGSRLEHLPKFAADFGAWRMFCALEMRDTTKGYIESHRPVDRAYLEEVRETFKKFVALSRR